MGSVTPTPIGGKRGSIYPRRRVDGSTNSSKMGTITPISTALKTGSIWPIRSVKGGTNSTNMGSIMPTPTAEKRATFTLTDGWKAGLTPIALRKDVYVSSNSGAAGRVITAVPIL